MTARLVSLIVFMAILLFGIGIGNLHAQIVFTPAEWNFGSISQDKPASLAVFVTNQGSSPVEIKVIPTCDCLTAEPAGFSLAANGKQTLTLHYDPSEDSGKVSKNFLVKTNLAGMEKAFFGVSGEVAAATGKTDANPQPTKSQVTNDTGNSIKLILYYMAGCKDCERFVTQFIPAVSGQLGRGIEIDKRDITDPQIYNEYLKKMKDTGNEEKAIPVLFVGNHALQGISEMESKIKAEVADYLKNGPTQEEKANTATEEVSPKEEIALVPAILTGLLDGINPCAFATIIALLTGLTLAGKKRQEILIMGIFYTLAVLVTYYLIGLGFFKAVRLASGFPIVSIVIRWLLFAVLVVFAVLSFYDYFLIKSGKSKEMVLQLPTLFKKKIQTTIKTGARSTAIVISSIALGFLVSLFELGCTGQVYLPFITVYVLGIKKEVFGYFLLLVYNIAFILPLIVVFILTYFGLNSKQLQGVLEKNLGIMKVLLGFLFIALSILTLIL